MDLTDRDIEMIVNAIRESSEYDFSDYSFKSLNRRLTKILTDYETDLETLTSRIRQNREYLEKVVKDSTVNTTELFRDPPVWHFLRKHVLPEFRQRNRIKIWHAGCSTGQEVYSMLMLLHELDLFERAEVAGSDLNESSLLLAMEGNYKYRFNLHYLDNFDTVLKEDPVNPRALLEVPYDKYMEINQVKDSLIMKEFLRNKPVYLRHDLVKASPLEQGPFDLILCRNVIIYFNFDLQNRVIRSFHQQLVQGGVLLLGSHESILGPQGDKFQRQEHVYRKK